MPTILVLIFMFMSAAWSAEQEVVTSRDFSGRFLGKLYIGHECFERVPACIGVFERAHFALSYDVTQSFFLDLDRRNKGDGQYGCKAVCAEKTKDPDLDRQEKVFDQYVCKAVCAAQAQNFDFEGRIPVYRFQIISLSFEEKVCQSLFANIAQKLAQRGPVRYCASFKSARSMLPVAEANGIELFVGKSLGHPDHCSHVFENDYARCFQGITKENPSEWVFVGASEESFDEAGEFLHMWLYGSPCAVNSDARVSFYFAFNRSFDDAGLTVRNRIIQAFLKARRISLYENFDEKYKKSEIYTADLKEAKRIFKKHVCVYGTQQFCAEGCEVILPCNTLNALFPYKPRKDDVSNFDCLERIDVLVGTPPDMAQEDKARYLTSAYMVYDILCERYQGQRKVGCINGLENPALFGIDKHLDKRGPNACCCLVYVKRDDHVADWAFSICTRFDYKRAYPLRCLEKSCYGKHLLLALDV